MECPCPPSGAERINSFALVCYLPGALGAFLDGLRAELVTTCSARSHVTILPPRQLVLPSSGQTDAPELQARQQMSLRIPEYSPFRIDLGNVEVFPGTKVIYLDLTTGNGHLHELHDSLNVGALSFAEPFVYHPHVTLAQGLLPENVNEACVLASARWREFQHSTSFQVESLTFVQNTSTDHWLDLAEYELGTVVAAARR